VGVMRRRAFLRLGASAAVGTLAAHRTRSAAAAGRRARVVIAGGGFAGSCCALELKRLRPATEVTLVDGDSRYVTCPLSNEVLVGARSLESLGVARAGLQRAGVRFVHARVAAIEAQQRRVRLQPGTALAYDKLVVAPGIRLLFGKPEGYDERAAERMPHAWLAGAQTERLALQLQTISDGATLAISVPGGLMRCPPGPYERASLIAGWLKQHRPRSKVLIFDANNHFPRQDVFTAAWQQLYPGMIEWIPPAEGGALTRVDIRTRTLYSESGAHRVAVANIIPPQAPGLLAAEAGLASGHGWCPVRPASFESELLPDVHVIGDACIAGAMPKSASAARSQALQCAAAIAAGLDGRPAPALALDSVCYSLLSLESAIAMRGSFALEDGEIRQVQRTAGAPDQPPLPAAAREAADWYARIRSECFAA